MQTPDNQTPEKREHFRIPSKADHAGTVDFQLDGGDAVHAQLVDLSGGGLRCRVSQAQSGAIAANDYLPRIRIQPQAQAAPLTGSGTVVRISQNANTTDWDCAVKLSAVFASGPAGLVSGHAAADSSIGPVSPDYECRLDNLPAAPPLHDHAARQTWRAATAAAYRDLLSQLPGDQKWWFLEVAEQLKQSDGQVQTGLLNEYFKLCESDRAQT